MKYIAHKDGEREQTIKEHLCGTAQLAGEFAEKFGKGEWGYCCGKMHDIGKYSQEFQEKIKKNVKNLKEIYFYLFQVIIRNPASYIY